jgi:hemolysin activation/secretion protein
MRNGMSLSVALGLGYHNADIDYEEFKVEADRLRTAFLGLGLEGSAGVGSYALAARWRAGLDALGARIDFIDGSTMRPSYNIGTFNAAFAQPIGRSWRLRAEAALQSSSRRLPYIEKFKVGGAQLGRGLGTAVMAGDSGVGGALELRYFIPGMPVSTGKHSAYTFTDYGTVWQRGVPGRDYMGTAGIGIAADYRAFQLHLEAGRPILFRGPRLQDTSLFGGIQYRF